MMAGDPAKVIRARREAFAFALAEGISVAEAIDTLARARWADTHARLAAKRCGTRIEQSQEDSGRPLQWWQRD
ncbi:MAG: hypothetical protein OSB00_17985 [Sphingomonas bacterium]|nr:hypothetical protein [Sphingomonas bacterium]